MANDTKLYHEQLESYLERIARAMRRYYQDIAYKNGLNVLQLQILRFLSARGTREVTVRFVAEEMEVTEATVSDSLRSLEKKGLIKREKAATDKRVRNLALTLRGKKICDLSNGALAGVLKQLPERHASVLAVGLHELVAVLYANEQLKHAPICKTCVHFHAPAHCQLLHTALKPELLRFDCPEHRYAS